ncbi:polymer-forming cytoskeletal protein, partial [Clostridium perfringens]
GQMYGDVYAASLIVMEGGLLNGASRMEHQTSTQEAAESTDTTLPLQRSEAG